MATGRAQMSWGALSPTALVRVRVRDLFKNAILGVEMRVKIVDNWAKKPNLFCVHFCTVWADGPKCPRNAQENPIPYPIGILVTVPIPDPCGIKSACSTNSSRRRRAKSVVSFEKM